MREDQLSDTHSATINPAPGVKFDMDIPDPTTPEIVSGDELLTA